MIILFWTADMNHKSFVIADGPEGNNGKSSLRRCISAIAPRFQSSINKGLVILSRRGKDYSSASNEITNLGNGIRFGFTDELNMHDRFDVRSIKEFTGQTEMSMRRNYQDTDRVWSHVCSLWLSTNNVPRLPADDTAFRSRCIFLEFIAKFMEKPDLEKKIKDCMGNKHRAEYKKDPTTEQWIIDGDGKQVFFNLLVQVFCKNPKMPDAVKIYTRSKFNQQDTAFSFLKEYAKPHEFAGMSSYMKNIVTVTLKGLVKLYEQYVLFRKLGTPQLLKHMKFTLVKENYVLVKTNKAIIIRGIVFNTENLKVIFKYAPNELVQFFNSEYGLSIETYQDNFNWDEQATGLVSLGVSHCSSENEALDVMKPLELVNIDEAINPMNKEEYKLSEPLNQNLGHTNKSQHDIINSIYIEEHKLAEPLDQKSDICSPQV